MQSKTIQPGETYNRLTILSLDHKDHRYRSYFLCRCECGVEKVIHGAAIKSGNTKSCGCLIKECQAKKRIPDNYSEVTAIILGYKRHAKSRGFKWLLSREDVIKLIFKPCNYCGESPSNIKKTRNSFNGGLYYSGIDRMDSSKDYSIDNVVPCCKICNFAKSNMSIEEFHEWAIRIGKRAMALQWG